MKTTTKTENESIDQSLRIPLSSNVNLLKVLPQLFFFFFHFADLSIFFISVSCVYFFMLALNIFRLALHLLFTLVETFAHILRPSIQTTRRLWRLTTKSASNNFGGEEWVPSIVG